MAISSSFNSSSSTFSSSVFHVASSATLLSARRYAFACASVNCSAIMQGTRLSPSFLAARRRVCPVTIILSRSRTKGTLKPNSLMLEATASMAPELSRGLLTYGMISFISNSVICIFKAPDTACILPACGLPALVKSFSRRWCGLCSIST